MIKIQIYNNNLCLLNLFSKKRKKNTNIINGIIIYYTFTIAVINRFYKLNLKYKEINFLNIKKNIFI